MIISIFGGAISIIMKIVDAFSPITWVGMWFFYLQVFTLGGFMLAMSLFALKEKKMEMDSGEA